ncbi:MAG: hypothetical protein A2166_02005 [Omnitrophica WOR_2 bacterium RBG_13_41_10]|nr:MAG: hypothetical protein A2166_02005 [Omnitrophica WOR_2 bacterium RBG_13_41_10]
MKLFKKVAIVGVGLIGGSIALAIKKKRLAYEVVGITRHKRTLSLAKKSGTIDRGSQALKIIKGADLLILATPVNTILNLAPAISKIIDSRCIVMDVGSTKEAIVAKLDKIFPQFVGAHPLAGSERRGVINASSSILEDSLCILTPTAKTSATALKMIQVFWKQLGSRVSLLTPKAHDKILSLVSHLPHLAAFSLIETIPAQYLKFSASGLKGTSRVALSDAQLWADIFLTNRKNMLNAIRGFEKNISRLKSAIKNKNKKQLISILEKARNKRERIA